MDSIIIFLVNYADDKIKNKIKYYLKMQEFIPNIMNRDLYLSRYSFILTLLQICILYIGVTELYKDYGNGTFTFIS